MGTELALTPVLTTISAPLLHVFCLKQRDLCNPVWIRASTSVYSAHSAVKDTHTLVELASLTTGDEAFAIWIPGYAGQAILVRLAHLCSQLPRLDIRAKRCGRWK